MRDSESGAQKAALRAGDFARWTGIAELGGSQCGVLGVGGRSEPAKSAQLESGSRGGPSNPRDLIGGAPWEILGDHRIHS